MGHQQLLLIVLGILIVGIAIGAGISIFNNQARQMNRLALISEMNIFASNAIAYYKTPQEHGGGGGIWNIDSFGVWSGFNYDQDENSIQTQTGKYIFSSNGDILIINGTGTEVGNDGASKVQATLRLHGDDYNIETTIEN